MEAWKTLSRKPILKFGKFLTVENHVVELPDGRIINDWSWVITPDYVNVVVTTRKGTFLCFRQVKYGIEGESLSIVGGFIEPGEEPLLAAKRELLEETGYASDHWTSLGNYRVDPNRGAGMGYLYLAQEAYPVTERNADDLEEQYVVELSQIEVEQALRNGEYKTLAWTTNIALALLHLKD